MSSQKDGFIIAICVVECVYPEVYYSKSNENNQATENPTNYSRQIDFLILSMLLEDQNRVKISLCGYWLSYGCNCLQSDL